MLIASVLGTAPASAAELHAGPRIGQPAPDFTGTDSNGGAVSLSALRGRTVVLEWSNHQCPFVGKHYRSGNMQSLQRDAARDGVAWITIVSSAPGTQGFVTAAEANELTRSRGAAPMTVVLDPSGAIGREYGAKTTPHMFVIDPRGTLIYMGAIDDRPTTDVADIAGARNYVKLALAAVAAGTPLTDTVTQPYGCSVKYR
jgi:hypothetical protein